MITEILVDGDSCPVAIRPVLIRAGSSRRIRVLFLANQPLPLGDHHGMDVVTERTVDEEILNRAGSGSLVVTRDIPLAEQLVGRGVAVINDRGRIFQADSIRELRSLRDAAADLRRLGLEQMDRRRTFGAREVKAFADALDRVLAARNGANHDRLS